MSVAVATALGHVILPFFESFFLWIKEATICSLARLYARPAVGHQHHVLAIAHLYHLSGDPLTDLVWSRASAELVGLGAELSEHPSISRLEYTKSVRVLLEPAVSNLYCYVLYLAAIRYHAQSYPGTRQR